MEKRLDRLEDKIDNINDTMVSIEVTMTKNTESLIHHMRRTDANEELIRLLREDLKPVETHVKHLQGAMKLIGFTGAILGILKLLNLL